MIYRTFTALGLEDFQIRLNNRKVLSGLFDLLGLGDKAADVMRTIDKLEKIGKEKVLEVLTGEFAVAEDAASKLLEVLESADPMEALEKLKGQNELLDTGIQELSQVVRHMGDFGVPETHFKVDLTIARGLDYYTGTVYETQMTRHPEIGSICSGGRYDNLAAFYTDKQLPGVGISIGLTRLFYVLEEQGLLNDELLTAPADVLILPMTEDLSPAISLATQLRQANIRTQLYTEQKKFKAKMSYADKLKVPFVLFLGEDEVNAAAVSIKNMRTGEQETIPQEQAAGWLLSKIALLSEGKPIRPEE